MWKRLEALADTPRMIPPTLSDALAELPLGLRLIVQRELDAGNAVADAGHFFPAGPLGACVRMARPFASASHPLPRGVVHRVSPEGALWTAEFSDEQRSCFVVDTAPAASLPRHFSEKYTCLLDLKGETLTYEEPSRSVTMVCTLGEGYRIYVGTIEEWIYQNGHRVRLNAPERLEVARRVALYGRDQQGVEIDVED